MLDDHGNAEWREVVSVSEVVRKRGKGKHHAGEEWNGRFNDHWGRASGMDNRVHESCDSGDEAGKVDDDYGDQKPVQLSYDLSSLSVDDSEERAWSVSGLRGFFQGRKRRGSQGAGWKLGAALILNRATQGARLQGLPASRLRGAGAGASYIKEEIIGKRQIDLPRSSE